MNFRVFSVYDVKAELFSPPFFMKSKGEAIRAFKDLANRQDTTVGRHPDDFKLVELGMWDDESGQMEDMVPQVTLGFAREYVAQPFTPVGAKGET